MLGGVRRPNRDITYVIRAPVHGPALTDATWRGARRRTPRHVRSTPPASYNWIRPHEAIGFVAPTMRYLGELVEPPQESHLSQGKGVQDS